MDLSLAITKHAEWKTKFRAAIAKQETMDEATIGKDNCCELGKWLHGDAKAKYLKLAAYTECVSRHAAFHAEAAKVAKTINQKNYTQAESMLGNATGYGNASGAVTLAISKLKKEVGL